MTGYTSLNARLAKVIINANCVVIKHRCVAVVVVVAASPLCLRALIAGFARIAPAFRASSRANPDIDIQATRLCAGKWAASGSRRQHKGTRSFPLYVNRDV